LSAPRVSIVLPSFNGSRHLDEAVASVVAQTFKDWELVLVDDGSSDDTGARMEAWARRDPRIRALRLSPNRGLPAALNEGFRHARGELFTWTSDDNLYLPGALERMAEHLERSDDVDLVYADYLLFSDAGGERRSYVFSQRLLALRGTVGCCFLYRRDVHEELRGFDEQLFLAEDYDFWLRASTRFRFEAIHDLLYRYRVHDASLTKQRRLAAVRAAVRAMERHLPALPRRERAHARLQRARDLFLSGQPREGRALVFQALREWPGAALRSEHWRPLATCLLGARAVHRLRLLLGRVRPGVIRILLPGDAGGVTTDCLDLTAARPPGGAPVELCWLDDDRPDRALARDAAAPGAEREVRVRHRWPRENLFAVLRRMRRALGGGPGVIVANEFFGLAYAARYGRQNPLVQIVHQDAPMDYRLAETFEPFVDVFIALSAPIRDELCRRLPERVADVRYLRSGARERAGADFHAMLDDVARRPVPHRPVYRRGPGRLDRRWLPNALVRAIRALWSPKTGAG
jgi:hypothetical protein